MRKTQNSLSIKITNRFQLEGKVKEITNFGQGLVNKTFLVKTSQKNYIIQKINHFVFKKPYELMENVNTVTKHLKNKHQETLDIILTKDNRLLYENQHGFYRCYELNVDSMTYDMAVNTHQCLEAGITLGKFQRDLIDCDSEKLFITIPFFHDLEHRYLDLVKVYRKSFLNKERACDGNKEEIKKIMAKMLEEYDEVTKISKAINEKRIIIRPCHYDTKFNNILFDTNTNRARCMIDLDTVMPGCSLYDFGDAARVIISSVREDEKDLDKIELDFEKFSAFLIGYLKESKDFLLSIEKDLLINSIKTMVLELAIRFFTDYLDNDSYFLIKYEEHNLDRAKCQMALYQKICDNFSKLEYIKNEILMRLG